MSIFSALLSLALAMVSAVVLGAFCAFCSVLYAINLSMLGVGWYSVSGYDEGLREALLKERRYWRQHPNRGWITFAMTSVGALAVTLGSMIHWHEPHPSFCEVVAQVQRSGPIELVTYSDFQCSHCRELSRSLRSFRKTERLEIVQRHYPLDSACNSSVKRSPHPNACMQAAAAICAGAQGREDEFTDRLFDGGQSDQAGLATLAESLGLDGDRFTSCLTGGEGSQKLETIIAAGHANGVKTTPTLFVNGRKHVGRLSEEDLVCLQKALRD